MKPKKKALGRGLDAILQSPDTDITSNDISGNYVVGAIAMMDVRIIETNPFQPRIEFDDLAIDELSKSIQEQGIIQPLTVRKLGYDRYQLIAGERRYRAAKRAGLTHVPAYIRVANDEQMLELALVENIHREDLNAIEIAISYNRLIEECQLTQDQLSEKVGKNRTTISNYIRLLKLPAELQIALKDDQISMGHARALINIADDETKLRILKRIIVENLSVRQVEEMVRTNASRPRIQEKSTVQLPEDYLRNKAQLIEHFNTKVDIRRNNKGLGNIVISFESDEEFIRIINLIKS
ncbi:MAG: chromosome partitioning protein ParB [Bacteroidetes bacterium HGW-Bacteroidetes-17]|jgi:ParB family chromosome partitioning protein|nr:MAG: chromosome partitioning protein ParB [Bacteroidetes bacterium HGW-Bacteroidetes-17]